jgi:hypothetical protein
MRTRASDFGAALLVATAVWSCGHHHVNPPAEPYVDRAVWVEPTSGCSDNSPKSLPKFRVSDTLTGGDPNKDSQERRAWLARRVPGGLAFGRAFDDDHRPIIRLTDPTQKLAALATLDSLAPQNGRTRVSSADSFIGVRVRWGFAELYDWMQYLQTGFSAGRRIPMIGGGIDTNNDRLELIVDKEESLPILVSWLIEKGVPCRLVAIRVIGPIRGL